MFAVMGPGVLGSCVLLVMCFQATPLYLSEMAPYHLRGAMNFGFQLCVTIGILVAQLINYGTQVSRWRYYCRLHNSGHQGHECVWCCSSVSALL